MTGPSVDGAGPLLSRALARFVWDPGLFAEGQLQRPQAIAQRSRVGRTDLRCSGSHQPGQRGDDFARLIQVFQLVGVVALCQPGLHRGGTHQVHSYGVDELHGRHFCDIACLDSTDCGALIVVGSRIGGVLLTGHADKLDTV